MSLKHLTTQTLVSQVTDFRANVLASNEMDENESILVVVNEIWDNYDIN